MMTAAKEATHLKVTVNFTRVKGGRTLNLNRVYFFELSECASAGKATRMAHDELKDEFGSDFQSIENITTKVERW